MEFRLDDGMKFKLWSPLGRFYYVECQGLWWIFYRILKLWLRGWWNDKLSSFWYVDSDRAHVTYKCRCQEGTSPSRLFCLVSCASQCTCIMRGTAWQCWQIFPPFDVQKFYHIWTKAIEPFPLPFFFVCFPSIILIIIRFSLFSLSWA